MCKKTNVEVAWRLSAASLRLSRQPVGASDQQQGRRLTSDGKGRTQAGIAKVLVGSWKYSVCLSRKSLVTCGKRTHKNCGSVFISSTSVTYCHAG